MDYVNNNINVYKAMLEYNAYISLGWLPMSKEEIIQTAGINIDSNTLLKPPITSISKFISRFFYIIIFILYLIFIILTH